MASSEAAAQLTEGHRLAQARIAAQTARLLHSTWPLLDPTDLDATVGRWLRVIVPLVSRQRRQSVLLAGQYLRAFRAVELGVESTYVPVLDVPDELRAITTSLTVTGPVSIKDQARRLVPVARAAEVAEAKVVGAAMRHTLNGGRGAILDSVKADRRALGYARSTSGKPCSFCAMLASRGPVYKDDSFDSSDARFTGFGDAKVHDRCYCSLEPVYRRDADWPAGGRHYQQMWDEAKRMDGDTAINFRRLMEGRIPA